MSKDLKSRAAKGGLWSIVETLAVKVGQFVLNIILASLLLPSDFGLVGMLAIFISISQTLVASGMGRALVQKKDRTDLDFSTVFIFNLAVSISIYLILFFSAPLIADFYNTPQLTLLTRVLCLNIVINSMGFIQNSSLVIRLDFKSLAKVNVFSLIIGGVLAILLAYLGFGVWALVVMTLTKAIITTVLLFIFGGKTPQLKFSIQSFRELFGFSSKVLVAGVSTNIVNNLSNTFIGKFYSAKLLGFYTQGTLIARTGSLTISTIVNRVAFPIYSSKQDDISTMMAIHKKMLGILTFVLVPVMVMIALLSEPFVQFFLGEKWLPMVPFLQWLCFAKLVEPMGTLNLDTLNAKGRSDLYLKMSLLKIPLIALSLLVTIPISIEAVIIGQVVIGVIFFFIDTYWVGKLYNYGAWNQTKNLLPKLVVVSLMALSVYGSIYFLEQSLLKLIVGGITGISIYLLLSGLFKIKELQELKFVYNQIGLKKIFKR